MNYIKYQDKTIRKIADGYQNWYKAKSNVWGERYMKEKENILTKERNKKETRIIVKYLPRNSRSILDAPCGTKLYFNRYLDFRTSTSVTKIREVKKDGKTKNIVHIIRLYYPHELINICRKFSCDLIDILDQNGKAKDIKNSLRIWLIFQKK